MKTIRTIFLFLAVVSAALSGHEASAQTGNPDAILGVWKNGEGTGHIRIEKSGANYLGRIVWLKEPIDPETGKPKLDKLNPDKSKKSVPLIGMMNLWGFSYTGKNVWDDGKIYDPKKGSTYDCTIKMKDANTLDVRGYIGISLIGRTDTWTRQSSN